MSLLKKMLVNIAFPFNKLKITAVLLYIHVLICNEMLNAFQFYLYVHLFFKMLYNLQPGNYQVRLAPALKQFFFNVSFHILVASLTLMALF